MERLAEALGEPGTATEASEILRSLIERIVLTPKGGMLRAELYGDLAVLAGFAQSTSHKSKNPGSAGKPGLLSLVAGTRNRRDPGIVWVDV